MARYIDVDVLIEQFDDTYKYAKPTNDYQRGCNDVFDWGVKIIKNTPAADVVPKSEEGAECPTCHGTGRIGTTDWLTKGLSKKQLAEEKAKAIAEHEQHIKTEVAREIYVALYNEIIDARANNFDVIKEREAKHNVNRYEDGFCMYCDGKIHALDGILYFVDELIQKYTEVQDE